MSDKFIGYANSFQAIARLELESIRLLLDFLSHPESDLKFIHIAGTNGKGSVAAFLQSIFTISGKKTGKYISPNMISVCERISIDGKDITMAELEAILKEVEEAAEKVKEKLGSYPTQFEIWTAAAFCYFKKKACDLVILETGLGGARDATNVIETPLAAVITRVALDHTEYLGDTLSEIALQKAGIIKKHNDKKNGIVFTCRQEQKVLEVLKNKCAETQNKLIISDEAIIHTPIGINEVISYKDIKNLKIGLSGIHQIENVCIAIDVAMHFGISENNIRLGLENAKNIGRFELISKNPRIIFDGAHNPNGMKSLISGLKRYFPNETPEFVMGFMADKDISKSAEIIKDAYPNIKIFTTAVKDNSRSASAVNLADILCNFGLNAIPCDNISDAIEKAQKSNNFVVICGSLYLYKDLKEAGY